MDDWIRVRSAVGEFDVHRSVVEAGLPDGVVVVKGYPKSQVCRPDKPLISKGGGPAPLTPDADLGGTEK